MKFVSLKVREMVDRQAEQQVRFNATEITDSTLKMTGFPLKMEFLLKA